MKFLFLFLWSVVLGALGEHKYDGYQVFQVVPMSEHALDALKGLSDTGIEVIDFWKEPSRVGNYVDLMVANQDREDVKKFMQEHGMEVKILVPDVQNLIDKEKEDMAEGRLRAAENKEAFPIDQYHSHTEINNWLDSLAQAYPTIASTFSVGKSFEGRDMKGIKIGADGGSTIAKKGLWLDAGIHAREWIAPATAIYIINELVTKYNSNSDYKNLVDLMDFYILPSANPDGYEYTRSSNRMWRKTRGGPYCHSTWLGKKCCYGADPNRNWDYHWGEAGTSTNPCSDTFGGPKAFSEVETLQMSQWLSANQGKLQSYISLHSYSDLWMYPFAYKSHTYPSDVDKLKTLSQTAYNAIKATNGVRYEVGSPPDILYAAAGSSMDWANAVAKIDEAFTLELRPGSTDPDNDQMYGFALPAKYIIPTASEAWAGIKTVCESLVDS